MVFSMRKVDLIRVNVPRWKMSKGLYDEDKGVVFEYKWGFLKRLTGFNVLVESNDMLSNPKGRPAFLVDVKGVKSFMFKHVEIQGKSVKFIPQAVVKENYDGDKQNELSYLIRPAFWESLGHITWSRWMKLSVLLAGMGVMQLLRIGLQAVGVYLP